MILSIIAALAENKVIGVKGGLPWYLPADLAHFKKLTMGKPVIVGRTTYQTIGRPLPGRRMIILTRDKNYRAAGSEVAHSVREALELVRGSDEVMVAGGAKVYEEFLPFVSRMYLTLVQAEVPGDVYFPEYEAGQWTEVARVNHAPDRRNQYPYSFVTLEKKS